MQPAEAHFVDKHVGVRIRVRRREVGVSQEHLAEQIGCTSQQVQKYENAKNRVSMSRLYAIALALKVEPPYFFEGLPASGVATDEPALAPTREGVEAIVLFARIKNPQHRRSVLDLARAIADEDAP